MPDQSSQQPAGTPPSPAQGGTSQPAGSATPPPQEGAGNSTPPATGAGTTPPAAAEGKPAATLLTGEPKSQDGQPTGQTPPPAPLDLKPPKGVDPTDPGFVAFKQYAIGTGLNQKQAEGVLELWAKSAAEAQKSFTDQQNKLREQWISETKSHKELGGENFAKTLATTAQAMKKFGTPALMKVLDESGLGNHPEMVRLFYTVGKALSEDSITGGSGQPTEKLSKEEKLLRGLYPSMFPKEE